MGEQRATSGQVGATAAAAVADASAFALVGSGESVTFCAQVEAPTNRPTRASD